MSILFDAHSANHELWPFRFTAWEVARDYFLAMATGDFLFGHSLPMNLQMIYHTYLLNVARAAYYSVTSGYKPCLIICSRKQEQRGTSPSPQRKPWSTTGLSMRGAFRHLRFRSSVHKGSSSIFSKDIVCRSCSCRPKNDSCMWRAEWWRLHSQYF